MKLSDIFGKLGDIEVYTLVKWYGRAVLFALISLIVLLCMSVAFYLAWVFLSALWSVWPGLIVFLFIVITGLIAAWVTSDHSEDFPSYL